MQPTRRNFARTVSGVMALSALGHPFRSASASDNKPRIKVGQIGTSHAHASKLAVYRQSPDYEVVGLVEPDPERRKAAESQAAFRDLNCMTTEELLNVPGLQAVLVETEVRDLLSTAETCVAAGKHVHIDKPAGASLPHFKRVLDLATQQKLLVQMGYMFRYNPGVVLLREFLENGWLGEIFEVHTVMSKVVDPVSRRELAEYPGGIMFELGCHVIDLVIGVLGAPDKVTPFPRRVNHADNLVDNMLAVFEYERATATVKSSAIEVDGGARRHLVVCGTEGTFHIQPLDNPTARVTLTAAHDKYVKGPQTISFPKYVRYVDDAADMAKIIRGEKETDFSPAHDLLVQTSVLQAAGMSTTQ